LVRPVIMIESEIHPGRDVGTASLPCWRMRGGQLGEVDLGAVWTIRYRGFLAADLDESACAQARENFGQ